MLGRKVHSIIFLRRSPALLLKATNLFLFHEMTLNSHLRLQVFFMRFSAPLSDIIFLTCLDRPLILKLLKRLSDSDEGGFSVCCNFTSRLNELKSLKPEIQLNMFCYRNPDVSKLLTYLS